MSSGRSDLPSSKTTIHTYAFPLSKMSIFVFPPTSYTTSPHLHSQLMTSPHTLLRKWKQSDRNIFIFAISQASRLPASVFIFSAFHPVAKGEASLLPSKADKSCTCAWDFIPCLLKDVIITIISLPPVSLVSPSVLNHPHLHTNIF